MSDILQLGQHPDADQLSAFAENCLPAHERKETLVHLADCSACRQIVALSLPPLEEPALPPAEPEPTASPSFIRDWFSGWKVAWIAAPALAALLFLTLHVRDSPKDRKQLAQPAQVAEVRPRSPQSAVQLKSEPPVAQARAASPATVAKARKPRPSRAEPAMEMTPVNGRELAIAKEATAAGQANGGPIPMTAGVAGIAPPFEASTAQRGAARAQQATVGAPSENPLARSTPSAPEAHAAAAPPPAAFATDNLAGSYAAPSGKAQVRARGFAGFSALAKSAAVSVPAPLPSGLPMTAYAANLHQRVAIDAQHKPFYSEDDGRHWKQVSPPWHGQAIAVGAIPPAASHSNFVSLAVPERFAAGATASAQIAAQPLAPASSLGGAVMDATGAAIPGAAVVIQESRYALVRTGKSDATGHYFFANLAPGSYRIDAQAPGFVKQSLVENLGPSQQATRNLVLSVGQTTQTVTVDAASVQLETRSRAEDFPADAAKRIEVPASSQPPAVFVVTTDSGERWTSFDGQNWKHE